MVPPDDELLRRIAGGDRAAFGSLYDRYAPRLFGLLLRILGDRADAEDTLQVTFWQVWKQAADYDPARSTPDVWLLLMARSRAMDHRRRLERRPKVISTADTAEGLCPIDPLVRSETADRVRKALARLPHDQLTAIRMAFFDGLTHEQIAESLATPLGTVKSRIRRGMELLQYLLDAEQKDRPG